MLKVLLCFITLAFAVPATAAPILPTDLDTLLTGGLVDSVTVPIETAVPPPLTMGTLDSEVFFDGTNYTYVNTVNPTVNDNSHFNTAFPVRGFTGTAGWSFSDASAAGGTGTALDFLLVEDNQRLHWLALNQTLGNNWDMGESISFFFVSNLPPTFGDYNLLNGEAGTGANAFAPVPEPGTLMLLGSGLAALYGHQRRRRAKL